MSEKSIAIEIEKLKDIEIIRRRKGKERSVQNYGKRKHLKPGMKRGNMSGIYMKKIRKERKVKTKTLSVNRKER